VAEIEKGAIVNHSMVATYLWSTRCKRWRHDLLMTRSTKAFNKLLSEDELTATRVNNVSLHRKLIFSLLQLSC